MTQYATIGQRIPRVDGPAKVTGGAIYTADIYLKGMLYAKILRSPYPHAKILHIDTSRAKRLAGIRAVVSGADTSGAKYGPQIPDKPPFALDKVRYVGDEIAAVAADSIAIAEKALELIKVDYEILPAVFDPFEAMEPSAPQIHEHAPNNISWHCFHQWGLPVDELLDACDVVLEDSFKTHSQIHAYLEPHCSVATWDQNGNVTLWATTQGVNTLREEVGRMLGIPEPNLRVIKPALGGGFGGKRLVPEPSVAAILLSKMAGKPVKVEYSREEEFTVTRHRHAMNIGLKIGARKDGKLVFFDAKNVVDNGAYNSSGIQITFYAGHALSTNYRVQGVRYDAKLVYTNTNFGGPYRGYGNLQMRFALESMMDMLAEELNMDPAEIRLLNVIGENETLVCKAKVTSCGLSECIQKVTESSNWREKRKNLGRLRGVGISCYEYGCGAKFHYPHDASSAIVKTNSDGSVDLLTMAADIGQGSDTTLCQIVAEVLGINMDRIKIITADTEITPLDIGTYASRITLIAGNAVKIAATEARDRLAKAVAEELEVAPGDMRFRDNRVYVAGSPDRGLSFPEAVKLALNKKGLIAIGSGSYNPPNDPPNFAKGEGSATVTYSFGAQVVEVEVDPETGSVRVVKVYTATDCGFAMNPLSLEGQAHGSISHSQGMALFERPFFDDGKVLNPSFLDYQIPTSTVVPEVDCILVETIDPEGPFGAKGVCEGYSVPTAPAIANAIYHATGIRVKEIPVNSEEILKGLEQREQSKR